MALDVNKVFRDLVAAAAQEAGESWTSIRSATTVELQGFARRLALIARLVATGDLTKEAAREHLNLAQFHVVATIAMLTTMAQATVSRIVRAALSFVKDAVNTAAGFVLL